MANNSIRWSIDAMVRDGRLTARRRDAEGAISLLTRRTWHADDDDQQDADGTDGDTTQNDWSALPAWAQTEFAKTKAALEKANGEAARRRKELNDAENVDYKKQLDELKKQQKKQLEEAGNFKSLYETQQAEMAALQAKAERADQLDKQIREDNAARIQEVREDRRTLVESLKEDLSPEKMQRYLNENWALLTAKTPPGMDAGVGGDSTGKTPVKLTAVEREAAKSVGMSVEDYAKFKAMSGATPELSTNNNAEG